MKEIEQYKKSLDEERVKLEEELNKIGIHDPKDPTNWVATAPKLDIMRADANEAADATEEMHIESGVLDELKKRHDNILRALSKIEEGTFGTCELGDEKIEKERLEANPAARTCKAHMENEGDLKQ